MNRSSDVEDSQVDELLSQFEEENLLKLNVNSHRSTDGFNVTQHSKAEGEDYAGLGDELASRFSNLKAKPPSQTSQNRGMKQKTISTTRGVKKEGSEFSGNMDGIASMPKDVKLKQNGISPDELEARLQALKAPIPKLSSSAKAETSISMPNLSAKTPSTLALPLDDIHSYTLVRPSSAPEASKGVPPKPSTSGFSSPWKLLRQLSKKGTKASTKDPALPHETLKGKPRACYEDEMDMSDVQKLLDSVASKVRLEQDIGTDSSKNGSLSGDSNIFNSRDMKKQLMRASSEEQRLAKEAQELLQRVNEPVQFNKLDSLENEEEDLDKVVEWAKDAARLDPSDSDEKDDELEDLELDAELELAEKEELEDLCLQSSSESNKKKGKGWSLF